MKTDGFGVIHDKTCTDPSWGTRIRWGKIFQQCRNCRAEWRRGDPSTPPRPIRGYRK